jgi:hypothetical protein
LCQKGQVGKVAETPPLLAEIRFLLTDRHEFVSVRPVSHEKGAVHEVFGDFTGRGRGRVNLWLQARI